MSERYSAGVATAYGAALRGGYTGTYNDFCNDIAKLGDITEELGNISATATTLEAGSSATASYNEGVFSFGIPRGNTGAQGETGAKGDKGDKGDTGETGATGATGNGIASIAKTGTSGLVDTYTITFTDGTTTTFNVTNGTAAIDDTLSIAGRAADAKATGDEISDLKEDLNESSNGQFILPTSKYTFKNGGLYQGTYNSSTPQRVVCDTLVSFPYDVTLNIKNGFKVGVHRFVNGTYSSDSGWQTGAYTISAGDVFKFVIARTIEISTETADIPTFVSMVVFQTNEYTKASTDLLTLKNNLYSLFESIILEWEQGGVNGSNGTLSTSSSDIRTKFNVYLPAGEYMITPNGLSTYYFYYSASGTYVTSCAGDRKWGVNTPYKLYLATDSYIRFVQNKTGGLLPSGALLTITRVFPAYRFDLQNFSNGIVIMSKQGEGLNVPPQSLISIKEAFKNLYDGYRINICKTSDGYYVLSHNRSINSVAKNSDNSDISTTINIDEHTLAELNEYDYGIRYGKQYAGLKITELSDAVALCAKLGLKLDIEWKYPEMTQGDVEAIYDTIVFNGFSNKNWHWIAKNVTEIGYFKAVCDYVDIEVLITTNSVEYYRTVIDTAMSDNHNVIVGYSDGNLTQNQVVYLRKLNVTQNRGTATNISQMIAQIESGVTELECNFYNPKQALIEYALNN